MSRASGRRTGRRRSLHLRGRGPFLAERLKKPLSLRKILAIEGRQCVLDGFGNVLLSNRRKKTLSGRIIPVIQGCQCLPERINRCPVERRDRDRQPPISWFLPIFPAGGFFSASTEGSASCAITAFAWPSSRAPVAGEPSPDAASAAGAGVAASDPIGLATDNSQTWLYRLVSPGAEEFSEFKSASVSLSASDDVSSIPNCALNSALRIFCGGAFLRL